MENKPIRVLIIGGYGTFGQIIAASLAKEEDLHIIIAGRSLEKARSCAQHCTTTRHVGAACLDITKDYGAALNALAPDIVIHTSGPFQTQDRRVAEICIAQGRHYIDLADGRAFVSGINSLDLQAKDKNVLVVSGASSVPSLTSSVIDHYKDEFKTLETLDYAITTAQKSPRGLATTKAILSYVGKPIQTLLDGAWEDVYGWQNLHARYYAGLGRRWLGNCDVPDLDLFPQRYKSLKTIRFYAGIESPLLHCGLWLMSWGVRAGLAPHLEKAAPLLLQLSNLFNWVGSGKSGFHMELGGITKDDQKKSVVFELTAHSGDGINIPCIPAILITKKLARGEITQRGAFPCMGFISLDDYLAALKSFDIRWETHRH